MTDHKPSDDAKCVRELTAVTDAEGVYESVELPQPEMRVNEPTIYTSPVTPERHATPATGDQPNTNQPGSANGPDFCGWQLTVEDETWLRRLARSAVELDPSDGNEPRTWEAISPDLTPSRSNMRILAQTYLGNAILLFWHSAFGWSERRQAEHLMAQFERVVGHLGATTRREMLDGLDRSMSRQLGDEWEVFKSIHDVGLWSRPPDPAAVFRVARAIPEELSPEEADRISPDYLDVLRKALEKSEEGDLHLDWRKGGF